MLWSFYSMTKMNENCTLKLVKTLLASKRKKVVRCLLSFTMCQGLVPWSSCVRQSTYLSRLDVIQLTHIIYFLWYTTTPFSLLLVVILTLFEIFIFCTKIQLWFPDKIVAKMLWFGTFCLLTTLISRKKKKKKKLVKNSRNWIFGQKFDFSNSVTV